LDLMVEALVVMVVVEVLLLRVGQQGYLLMKQPIVVLVTWVMEAMRLVLGDLVEEEGTMEEELVHTKITSSLLAEVSKKSKTTLLK